MPKFRILAVLFLTTLLFSHTVFAEGKVDPLLKIMADTPSIDVDEMAPRGLKALDGVVMAEALIKAAEGEGAEAKAFIEELGGGVRTVIGDIMTASIPLAIIEDLDASPLIETVEAAKPLTFKMNAARNPTADGGSGVAQVQAGSCTGCSPDNGSSGYKGTNVIVGVIDTGIDCQNADFKDSTGKTTRIISYWDQSIAGSGVSEITGSTGKEYTGASLTDGTCGTGSPDTNGHGTHVTGIAAGSNDIYMGVAPTASIIAVKTGSSDGNSAAGTFSTSLIDGTNYIFKKADSLTKAAVVNLSLGTHLGAHDGTSVLEQGLDALLVNGSADKNGRAIINAAGNENLQSNDDEFTTLGGIHATINSSSDAGKGYEIKVRNSAKVVEGGGITVDFWLDSGTNCTVRADGYNVSGGSKAISMTDWVTYGASTSTATDNSVTISLNYSETATSGKKHGTVTINRTSASIASTILSNYYFYFAVKGTCTGNAWLDPDNTNYIDFTKQIQTSPAPSDYTYAAGDSDRTIVIPGTAGKIITVGSYMDRASWVSMDGKTYYQTATDGTCGAGGGTSLNISLFSSLGPTTNASDLQKPDIVSPGEPILATLSSSITSAPDICSKGDANHYKQQGTSMAAPHVTGTVALMFQKNNCLTPTEVKTHLRNSATTDASMMGTLPNYIWGYGKLNAPAVMNLFSANSSCYTPTPSGGGGSSGCSLSGDGGNGPAAMIMAVFCAAACYLALRLARKRFL